MPRSRVAVAYCVHDDAYYLGPSIRASGQAGPVFVFVNRLPWNDQPGDWEAAAATARDAGAEVVLVEHAEELAHREAAREWLERKKFTHAVIPDGDEIPEPGLLEMLVTLAQRQYAERITVEFDTYWKSLEYVIRPRERITPQFLIDVRGTRIGGIRLYEGGRHMHLTASYGVVHHLSYVGPEERIRRKLSTWSHRPEVRPNWWEEVWLRWDRDKLLRNLHPTHPIAYGSAERIPVPEVLQDAYRRWQDLTGTGVGAVIGSSATPAAPEAAAQGRSRSSTRGRKRKPAGPPRVSVVIPLHGGEADIRLCLQSLAACKDLVSEVVVVDDHSPDGAAQVAATFEGVRVMPNEGERGFASACNLGLAATKGELVLFLNSDTVVPRIGLQRLVEALLASDEIAAAGPYTNRAGHGQQIEPTYTSLERLDLFAEDFAAREGPDVNDDMLSGFCLLVRRKVLEAVGPFDPRFGLGTYEDNDLCYRMRRAGYRLVFASRAFVHHRGHQTLLRCQVNIPALLEHNERVYFEKWRRDLESGFASHLAGMSSGPIRFQRDRLPGQTPPAISDVPPGGPSGRPGAFPGTTGIAGTIEQALRSRDWDAVRTRLAALYEAEGPSEQWAHFSAQFTHATGGNPEHFLRQALSESPLALGPRLVLARHFLHTGREDEAISHLNVLARHGVAEAAFYLGIRAMRGGDQHLALN